VPGETPYRLDPADLAIARDHAISETRKQLISRYVGDVGIFARTDSMARGLARGGHLLREIERERRLSFQCQV
jgi:hypothetical protein